MICETEDQLRDALDRAVAAATVRPAGQDVLPSAPGGGPAPAPAPGVSRVAELIETLLGAPQRRQWPGRPARPVGPSAVSLDEAPPEPSRWPGVTVIVPTLGERPDLLELALHGIHGQDYPGAIRCLVVLDRRQGSAAAADGFVAVGPQDARGADLRAATRAVAAAAQAQVIDNERTPGLAGSRNTGILAAQDELVAFCDDDDAWLPGKLRAQVAALAAAPEAALACCGVEISYGETITPRIHPRRSVTYSELLRSRLAALHSSTFVLRRAVLLNEVGLVSEEIPGSQAEDYELLLRAARYGQVLMCRPQACAYPGMPTARPCMRAGRWSRWRCPGCWTATRSSGPCRLATPAWPAGSPSPLRPAETGPRPGGGRSELSGRARVNRGHILRSP